MTGINASGNVNRSRFVLKTWMKAAIIVVTLGFLALTASGNIQRFGPLLFYLYGSLPFAYILTYLKTGKRITEENSTNVGVANSYNTAGMAVGTLTVIGEISKGLLPLLVSYIWASYSLDVSAYLLIGSLLGTNFSIFLKLKGGMGTTMMLWSFLFLSPLVVILLLLMMVVLLKLIKNTYHMTLLVYIAAPILTLALDGRLTMIVLALFAAFLFIIKYRPNTDDFAYGYGRMMSMRKGAKDRTPQDPGTRNP